MRKHHYIAALLLIGAAALGLASSARAQNQDPQKGEVVLDQREGWESTLVFDAGCGVWCVRSFQLYPELACPEIVAADDRGRATILVSYSGKWTPKATVLDGKWLAPMVLGHYGLGEGVMLLAGAGGRVYEVKPRAEGHADILLRAELPGEEIHTMLRIAEPGAQATDRALLFLKSGRLIEYRCVGSKSRLTELPAVEGRVRDALVETEEGEDGATTIWTVSRAGQVVRRVFEHSDGRALTRRDEIVTTEAMGLGRIARGSGAFANYFYVTRDDGVYLRLSRDGQRGWTREVIYRGEQGPRGIVAGRFDDDPEVETLAIFGYSGKVELLSRKGDAPFTARTLFVDSDAGHWLAKAELDGRNETEEIISSGFSGRVVMHSLQRARASGSSPDVVDDARNPCLDKETEAEKTGKSSDASRKDEGDGPGQLRAERHLVRPGHRKAPRLGVTKLPAAHDIDPLKYGGGFYTKTSTFLTLVERDSTGRLVPGLARSWHFEDAGKIWIFELDTDRVMQDGRKLDADLVRRQYLQILDDPAHDWLGFARYAKAIEARAPNRLVIKLDRPWAIEEELVAVNPFGVRAAGSFDPEGRFKAPLGSGPLRPRVEDQTFGSLVYVDRANRPVVELVQVEQPGGLIGALLKLQVDLVVDGWDTEVQNEADVGGGVVSCASSPGSCVTYLSFNLDRGLMARADLRRKFAAAFDRRELEGITLGASFLRDCRFWAAPTVVSWPRPHDEAGPVASWPKRDIGGFEEKEALVLLINRDDVWQVAHARVVSQLWREDDDGPRLELREVPAPAYARTIAEGDYDVLIERTWGLPYDPFLSLVARFDPPENETASTRLKSGIHRDLQAAVRRAASCPDAALRSQAMAEVQKVMTREVCVLPLFVRDRVALFRRDRVADFEGADLSPDPYSLPLEGLLRSIGKRP